MKKLLAFLELLKMYPDDINIKFELISKDGLSSKEINFYGILPDPKNEKDTIKIFFTE